MKILLAVDGSPCSDDAITEVSRRLWPPGSEVRVISVADWSASAPIWESVPATYVKDFEKYARGHAEGVADRAISKFRENKAQVIPISKAIAVDSPKDAIIEEAEKWGADLIVVGSHGYRAWERFLLGSVSQSVVAHAKCSVEVVRCANGSVTKKVA